MSTSLLSCHRYVPREFSKKSQSLSEFEQWKATEFRQFLLYSGIVVVTKGKLSDSVYSHFLLFFFAIFCLSSSLHIATYCDYADDLLYLFGQNWARLYGIDIHNVHGLINLASDAKKLGSLDSYSAFSCENFLGKLKKMLRKPNTALPRVIRRLSEMKMIQTDQRRSRCTNVHEGIISPVLVCDTLQVKWLSSRFRVGRSLQLLQC